MVYRLLALLGILAAAAQAAPPPAVALRAVATDIIEPTEITHAGDGSGRLFIVERAGLIRVLKAGSLLPLPFLDVRPLTSIEAERGLLGLAFHPRYATNGRFFIFYTQRLDGALRISSFVASTTNPDLADPGSEREVLTIDHPDFANHNGGKLAFGPDGYLYIGVGDGGSAVDPRNNAQDLARLLGKILRIDVDGTVGYAIPPDNPFVGQAGARPEIWAYGLRNPWRFSFDRATGDLYIGDVGQNSIEEIDFVARGTPAGLNFGWRVFEGSDCRSPPVGCSLPNHTPPALQYRQGSSTGFSVTGGFVYRGFRSARLRGYYIYGDFVTSRVWAAIREGDVWASYVLVEPQGTISMVSAFGEDEVGELYAASWANHTIYAIDGPGPPLNPMAREGALCPAGPGLAGANAMARGAGGRCR